MQNPSQRIMHPKKIPKSRCWFDRFFEWDFGEQGTGIVCIFFRFRRKKIKVSPGPYPASKRTHEHYYDPNGQLPTSAPDAVSCPWTFPRAKNCSTVRNFFPAFGWAALSSPRPRRKTPTTKVVGVFLAGALGLEPRAYGFGDRRSTN